MPKAPPRPVEEAVLSEPLIVNGERTPRERSPIAQLAEDVAFLSRHAQPLKADGSIGRTTFDTPYSDDLTLTVLLAEGNVQLLPSQSLVRIEGRGDKRRYLGVVVAGPFAEPDTLRHDSPVLLIAATKG